MGLIKPRLISTPGEKFIPPVFEAINKARGFASQARIKPDVFEVIIGFGEDPYKGVVCSTCEGKILHRDIVGRV